MQILRLLLAVTGSGMALVLAVVMLIYAVHMGAKPSLARELPMLAVTTVLFALIAGLASMAAWSRAGNKARSWAWDLALVLVFPASVMFMIAMYR